MKIPLRLQIFARKVVITDKDRERLQPHLGNWRRLNEMFLLGINQPDLERLIVLELLGKKRIEILLRLVQRLVNTLEATLCQRIARCLNEN